MARDTKDMTVLVTGASGRTGSRVARAAEAAGLTVRAASRERGFDWRDRSTWEDALRGADAAYLVYPPDVGVRDAARDVGLLAHSAVRLGVRRLVLLSARGEQEARPTEEALRESNADWTVLRSAWFAQNFSEGRLAEELRRTGELVFPAGEVREPFVDVRDVAEVVVGVLTAGDRYAGQALAVSGPRLLTWAEAVREIGAAAGRELRYRPVAAGGYAAYLTAAGVEPPEAEFLAELYGQLLDGRNAYLAEGAQQVLGRVPRDFADFAREAAAAGAWAG
ncbi:NmrA family NAD(P)-binding protein [Streptomyces sp. MS06]|uniref:NmrA family NAD(P)-binding protein n=1 Tax=Streptomyces sp. MS06 TaxID=3385974 RepID=UPI0039A0E124